MIHSNPYPKYRHYYNPTYNPDRHLLDQRKFLHEVKAAGGIAIEARSVEDIIEALGLQDRVRLC